METFAWRVVPTCRRVNKLPASREKAVETFMLVTSKNIPFMLQQRNTQNVGRIPRGRLPTVQVVQQAYWERFKRFHL